MLTTNEVTDLRALRAAQMTATAEHRNNPNGSSASTSSVASGIAITPLEPVSNALAQDYPIEKLYMLKQTFTHYTACRNGDFLVTGGVTYAVQASLKFSGELGTIYQLMLEERAIDG